MTVNSVSWNKIITVCSVFGLPFISVAGWIVIGGTQLVDKVDAQGDVLIQVVREVKDLHIAVDTLTQRQKDNKRDIDHQFELRDLKSGYKNTETPYYGIIQQKNSDGSYSHSKVY